MLVVDGPGPGPRRRVCHLLRQLRLPGVPRNITARQFTIRDSKGTIRGAWGVADDGTVRFVLSDGKRPASGCA